MFSTPSSEMPSHSVPDSDSSDSSIAAANVVGADPVGGRGSKLASKCRLKRACNLLDLSMGAAPPKVSLLVTVRIMYVLS